VFSPGPNRDIVIAERHIAGMNELTPTWPELNYASWSETCNTLQLWTQIVGKVRLQLTPWLNHSWQVPLYVTVRGLGTSPIPIGGEILELDFDFLRRRLTARTSGGSEGAIPLKPQPVADFYAEVVDLLESLGVIVKLNQTPCEHPNPIRFSADRIHRAYDPEAAYRFWRALIRADHVFKQFRTGFLGKVSPVHFFWGGFDLAITRFSGRPAPLHPPMPGLAEAVVQDAYSHEVSSAGFWPGSDDFPQAVFYSYAYPEPAGYRESKVTAGAYFDEGYGEFLLPYDTVRSAASPDELLLDFLSTTYAAAADAGHWDRASLECPLGVPARPRRLAV
jgi:hypothetical protein